MGNTSAESNPNDLLTCVLKWLMELFKAHTGGTAFLGGEEEAKAVEEDADAGDLRFVGTDLLQALLHAALHSVDPALWMLLQMPGWQPFDQIISAVPGGEDLAADEV